MNDHPEMGFMWPHRRGLQIVEVFDGQILASSRKSTGHLHCIEVPVLTGAHFLFVRAVTL